MSSVASQMLHIYLSRKASFGRGVMLANCSVAFTNRPVHLNSQLALGPLEEVVTTTNIWDKIVAGQSTFLKHTLVVLDLLYLSTES